MLRAAAFALLTALLASGLSGQPGPPASLVLANLRVLDVVGGRYQPVRALVVQQGRVAALQPAGSSPLPAATTQLDATGLTAVPGLIDVWVQAVPSPALDVDFFHALALAHGVTTARVVDARPEWLLSQRKRVRAGELLAPRIVVAGPPITTGGAGPAWRATGPAAPGLLLPSAIAASAAAVGAEVGRQAGAGVEWVRLGPALTVDAVRAAAARRQRARLSAAPGVTPATDLAAAGVTLLEGLYGPLPGRRAEPNRTDGDSPPSVIDPDRAWAATGPNGQVSLARRLAATGIAVTPLLRATSRARGEGWKAESPLLPDRLRRAQEGPAPSAAATAARRSFVSSFARAGGKIAAASGAGADGWPVPGLGLHLELAELTALGLSPLDAIRSATSVNAEVLGAPDEGRIAVGGRAAFFLVDGDPLTDIRALQRIRHICLDGELLDREALLQQAQRAAKGRLR